MNKSIAVTTIVIIAIGLVTLIMLLQTCSTSPRELTNTLNIEVFAECPIVDDSLDFQNEVNGFVSHFSTGQPSPFFLNPIVSFARLDQSGIAELSGLASDSIEIPVEFMNSFRAGVFPEQYTLEDRKIEEDEYFNVTCAEDQNYIRFRHNAIRASTCEPLQINHDMNDTVKEFLIDHSMASDYSDHHKKWKNSQLLHTYIEILIANKMVMAKDVIRVVYLKAPKVVVVADRDKDGVADEVDQCPDIKGEKRCEGCVCPPVIDNDRDKDRDGLNDDIDQCPNSYGSKKYKGCPIPDKDGDGLNDEIDQCPNEKGDRSNNGCPVIPRISHNNEDGMFIFSGVDRDKMKIEIKITLRDGRVLVQKEPDGFVYPSHDEFDKLNKSIDQGGNLTVEVSIVDKGTNKTLKNQSFKGLSLICMKSGDGESTCGFVDTSN